MSAKINRHLIKQTRFDSGSLTQLGFVAHQYKTSGRYKVDVYRENELRTSCYIDVDTDNESLQASIELSGLELGINTSKKGSCCDSNVKIYKINREGYALFYVNKGAGKYHVKSYYLESRGESYLFDSTTLNKGDLFGLTLLRPGRYQLRDGNSNPLSSLVVEAVKPLEKKYVPPEAINVELSEIHKMKEISLLQAQGIIFNAKSDNRVIIDFEDDDEKHQCGDRPIAARWTKSNAKRG